MVFMVHGKVHSIIINIYRGNLNISSRCSWEIVIQRCSCASTCKVSKRLSRSNNKLTLNIIKNKFVSNSNSSDGQSDVSAHRCNTDRSDTKNVSNLISRSTCGDCCSTCNNRSIINTNLCRCSSTVTSKSYKVYTSESETSISRCKTKTSISDRKVACSRSSSAYKVSCGVCTQLIEGIANFISRVGHCSSKTNSNLSRIETNWIRKESRNLSVSFS